MRLAVVSLALALAALAALFVVWRAARKSGAPASRSRANLSHAPVATRQRPLEASPRDGPNTRLESAQTTGAVAELGRARPRTEPPRQHPRLDRTRRLGARSFGATQRLRRLAAATAVVRQPALSTPLHLCARLRAFPSLLRLRQRAPTPPRTSSPCPGTPCGCRCLVLRTPTGRTLAETAIGTRPGPALASPSPPSSLASLRMPGRGNCAGIYAGKRDSRGRRLRTTFDVSESRRAETGEVVWRAWRRCCLVDHFANTVNFLKNKNQTKMQHSSHYITARPDLTA